MEFCIIFSIYLGNIFENKELFFFKKYDIIIWYKLNARQQIIDTQIRWGISYNIFRKKLIKIATFKHKRFL